MADRGLRVRALVLRQQFDAKEALLLDDLYFYEAAQTGIVSCGAEDIGFRQLDDLFPNRVFVDMLNPVEQGLGGIVVDPQGAAAILPQMKFFQAAQGLGIFFEMPHHPFLAEVHFHFYCFQDGGGGEFFKIPLEVGGCRAFFCLDDEVKVAAHQAPGVDGEATGIDKKVEGVCDHLFVGWSNKNINLIYGIQGQNVTSVLWVVCLIFFRQHNLLILVTK